MKCSHCMGVLDPTHVWVLILYTPSAHAVNVHPRCLIDVLGSKPARALSLLALEHGWVQPHLPAPVGQLS